MAYATVAELTTYMVTLPVTSAEAGRLLARASELIDELLIGAWYPVDTSGLPTVLADVNTIRDATCAQASYFIDNGDDQGTQSQYDNIRIGDVSLARGSGSNALISRAAPHAITILRNGKLLPITPMIVG
jgi:hypothetical protein